MIQINLLPGARKTRARGATLVKMDVGAIASSVAAKVKDPMLLGSVAAVLLAVAAVGGMYWFQDTRARALDSAVRAAEQDSIRFAAVIREKRKTEAQRDSVLMQLTLIRSIDGKRFMWPHVMDEVSRALPPYTWLTEIVYTAAAEPAPAARGTPPAGGDSAKAGAKKSPEALADSLASADRLQFRIVGNTVDIQALTRFMKVLEASPFIENVQLVKTAMVIVQGKEITEFQLDASYERPDPSAIRTTPLTLSLR
ncbi:MAG: PilN domain-containing protein [Gemmatimonadaceae bacterium]